MTVLRELIAMTRRERSRLHLCRASGGSSSSEQAVPPLVLPDAHPHFEIALCVSGAMRIVSHEKAFSLSAGDAVLIAPHAWHYETYERASGPYQSFWLTISPLFVGAIHAIYRKGFLKMESIHTLPHLEELSVLRQIHGELSTCERHWAVKVRLLMTGLLIDLDRRVGQGEAQQYPGGLEPVQHLFYIVKTRFREPLQIKQLAREVGMSADHLSRRFHASYGVTFKQCLNTTRINHAQHLLRRGHSIQEAAEAAGFDGVYYFSKVFKDYCGTTPGRFLKANADV